MASSNFEKYQRTRKSGDGIEYPYIELPENGSLPLKYESADYAGSESLEDEYEIHHIYVDCAEIASKGFPLDANPREPAETRQVKAMYDTLEDQPSDFVKKNNGVVVICSDIVDDLDSSVTMEFSAGEGICNGGHTYFAIMTADDVPADARLHFEVLTIPDLSGEVRKDVITDIAKARNNSNQLERRSEADFLGYYESFQNKLEHPELIEWHENDSNARSSASPISAVHFLRLIKSIDITSYRHPIYNENANTHKSLATSISRFHNSWIDQVEEAEADEEKARPFRYLLPLINDVMYLRDYLSYSFPKRNKNQINLGAFRKTRLYQDYIMRIENGEPKRSFRPLLTGDFDPPTGVDMPNTLEVLFMGLFRSNLFWSHGSDNASREFVGWTLDPIDLWHQRAPSILEDMGHLFSDLDKDPKQFIRINAPFNFDLYEYGMSKDIRPPSILYSVDNHQKYSKVESPESANYWMRHHGEDPIRVSLVSMDEEEPPSQAALYTEAENS